MKSFRTKFSVGLFVIIGMCAVVLFVLWLGMSEYFREGSKFTAYFDESVQGLSRDAAVKYRGVNVGQVDRIGVAPDGRLVEIVFTLDRQLQNPENLVAQIKSVGLTGIMFVELERAKPGDKTYAPDDRKFTPQYPVIETKPSDMKRLLTDINEILADIKKVDAEGISKRLAALIESMQMTLVNAEIDELTRGLQQTIENTNRILESDRLENLARSADKSAADIQSLISETRQAVERLDKTVAGSSDKFNQAADQVSMAAGRADSIFKEGGHTLEFADMKAREYDRRIKDLLDELNEAAFSLNLLIDQINRQPSRLIRGGPPEEKPVEPGGK
ncbi:MAG: MlaD family protein [Desulfosalsimonas sp.]